MGVVMGCFDYRLIEILVRRFSVFWGNCMAGLFFRKEIEITLDLCVWIVLGCGNFSAVFEENRMSTILL